MFERQKPATKQAKELIALTNIGHHAGVNQVCVVLRVARKMLKILVEDNGRAFSPETLHEATPSGLYSMDENAASAGGILKVESSSGEDTRVVMELPLVCVTEKG